jgi:N-carbamoyl-L-amino-acid hydrolase
VELHVEQGRRLAPLGRPVGVAEGIWPHGRWRVRLPGEANHAGTTPLSERRDPMLELAELVTTARAAALRHQGVATVGKLRVLPNSTNAIPAEVLAWLDARAPAPDALRALVDEVTAGRDAAQLSLTAAVRFDAALTDLLAEATGGPRLATAAGHDAGVLAAGAPAGMLFVRNPTGVSHSPAEAAETADCVAGVLALADVLERLL